MTWEIPIAEDVYYARLPFSEAQQKLGEVPPGVIAQRVTCGWHALVRDPETASFAIVNESGPLKDLVGKRIEVSRPGTSKKVYALVHRASDVMNDLSLTRKLFSVLGLLTEDYLTVDVRVVP